MVQNRAKGQLSPAAGHKLPNQIDPKNGSFKQERSNGRPNLTAGDRLKMNLKGASEAQNVVNKR
jgi:hypothetical protein